MNKIKLLTFSIVALLILNFGTLTFLFLKNPHRAEGRVMPRQIVIERLHFDTNQIASYDKLIKLHRSKIRKLQDGIRNFKNELYALLNQETIDIIKKDSLITNLAMLQKEIESTHFNHFVDIKKLCKKEQLSNFELLTEDLSKIFSHERKPKNE